MTPDKGERNPAFHHCCWPPLRAVHKPTYGRTGMLWDSRYKSSLVQAQTYLLLCRRYIELNPVRVSIVGDPAECLAGRAIERTRPAKPMPLLSPHPLYLALGQGDSRRQEAYRALFCAELDEAPIRELRMALNQNQLSSAHLREATGQDRR